jgi:hypothetical protein
MKEPSGNDTILRTEHQKIAVSLGFYEEALKERWQSRKSVRLTFDPQIPFQEW